jgi:hypothetical protein
MKYSTVDFVWKTKNGRRIPLYKMSNEHLVKSMEFLTTRSTERGEPLSWRYAHLENELKRRLNNTEQKVKVVDDTGVRLIELD